MTGQAARPDLGAYRRLVVAFSGGKDSLAALLHLLSLGVPPRAIELHHHDVDGHAGRLSSQMIGACSHNS